MRKLPLSFDDRMKDNPRLKALRWFLPLTALEGVLAVVRLVSLPGSAAGAFSLGRLALIAPGLALALTLAGAALVAWRRPDWGERQAQRLGDLARRDALYWAALVLCALVVILCFNLLLVDWMNTDEYVQAYLDRLAPYSLWGLLASLQVAIAMREMRFGVDRSTLPEERKILVGSVIALLLLLLVVAFMSATRLGLAPDQIAWGDPGVPILGWQVLLALGITLAGLLLAKALLSQVKLNARWVDFAICLILWTAAVWRWGAEPLRPSYFSPEPLPPTQEFFPYSDAANYDLAAHSLLAGYGLGGDVVRPFYSFFLAAAHAASGPGYQAALAWQIPLLALLPVSLYLIARSLHSRVSGFFVGLLAILQNSNAINLAGVEDVSHAKLLMSDIPTALGIAAILAVILLWLEMPEHRKAYPLIAGGLLGVVMLVRVQALVILPVALLTVWLGSIRLKRAWMSIGLLLVGFGCVLFPWLWRNWQSSGKLVLSEASQVSQIGLIGQRYSLEFEKGKGARLPDETGDQYSSRMMSSALAFVRQNPEEALRFISAHFLHNQVATFLVLPSAFPIGDFLNDKLNATLAGRNLKSAVLWDRCCTPRSYVQSAMYWNDWDGRLDMASYPLMFLGLMAVAIGIAAAWQRGWLRAALPLAVGLSYSLSNALVRNSGWRFNQPVDWIGYLFYGIGIVQLGRWVIAYFAPSSAAPGSDRVNVASTQDSQPRRVWSSSLLAGAVFLLLSAAIPISENAVPERYQDIKVRGILTEIQEAGLLEPLSADAQTLEDFLTQEGAEARVGRALYPRYFLAGDGEPGSGWPSFTYRPYDRLGFYLVGRSRRHVVLRTTAAPASFPHAADVLVLGCAVEEYLDAYLVILLEPQRVILERSPLESWTCP